MMSAPLAVALMLTGYVLVMGYLALGLRLQHRRPPHPGSRTGRGWPALIARVAATAAGGYLVLMVVLAAYAHWVGGGFLASALTGCALLAGIALAVFFLASWLWSRRPPANAPRGRGPGRGRR